MLKKKLIISPFNLVFWFTSLFFVGVLTVMTLTVKGRDLEFRKTFYIVVCLFNCVSFFLYKYELSRDREYDKERQFIGGFNWWGELPFHLCNINMTLMPLAVFFGFRPLMSFCFFMGPLGALMALLLPAPTFDEAYLFPVSYTHLTLILEAAKQSRRTLLYYECVRSTIRENTDNFVRIALKGRSFPSYVSFSSFEEVFDYIDGLSEKYLVVIDEYPYLKEFEDSDYVDSCFQRIIDRKYRNIDLILSGSHIGMMKQLLEEKNALFGRFTLIIKLEELDYYACRDFYKDLPVYDKAAFYSVFGGSPFVNQQIDGNKTLKQNICNIILDFRSSVFIYLNNLLLSDYSSRLYMERILAYLSNGRKKYSDIEMAVYHEKNGNLNKQLLPMIDMGLVRRNVPINRSDDKKKIRYEIGDNLLRFYYAYLYENLSVLQLIGPEAFYEEYIGPTIGNYISYRFESIGKQYFSLCVRSGKMKGIRNIGTYYYDDPLEKRNGEFDIALEKNKGFDIVEVKYLKNRLDRSTAEKEIGQIRQISELDVDKIGFISVSGFEEGINADYLISGEDLYHI